MNNMNRPSDSELPSSQQLIKSTIIAISTAAMLLLCVILPAEYGVDPTGVGQALGLTQMGDIKNQLANEAKQETQPQPLNSMASNIETTVQNSTADSDDQASAQTETAAPPETRSIKLKPGQAAEIKLGMTKDSVATYKWSVDIGHVNYDTHGDGEGINYFGYSKGRAVIEDSGELQASFDGKHGWFWRNRSDEVVTVTLIVSGDYNGIFRVL